LNNSALIYGALYQVTGKQEDLDQKAKLLEQAVGLQPEDSILLSNAADSLLEAAAAHLIGGAIDLKVLRITADLDLMSFLYRDKKGRDQLEMKLRGDPGILRTVSFLDRLQILRPRAPGAYRSLLEIHLAGRDLPALRRLQDRLAGIDLDQGDHGPAEFDFYSGKRDAELIKNSQVSLQRWRSQVEATRKEGGPVFALAVHYLALIQYQRAMLEQQVDADELVTLGEQADAAAPSDASRSSLVAALLFRASRSLEQMDAEYARMTKKARRSMGTSYLIAVALSSEGQLRDKVLANADIQRALELVRQEWHELPDEATEWTWVMLQAAYPEESAKVADAYRSDELRQARRAIEAKLSLLSATSAFQQYWAAKMAGEEAKGLEVLKSCAARGVPMPFDLK
jgi:hypothetical protein